MRRVAVTAGLLLLGAAAILGTTWRLLDCADGGGAKDVDCTRCRGLGRITLLNRALRAPADLELRKAMSGDRVLFDDAMHELLGRAGRPWIALGDRILRSGTARWWGPDQVVSLDGADPRMPALRLWSRAGRLLHEIGLKQDFVGGPLCLEGGRLVWPRGVWDEAPGTELVILTVVEGHGRRRFRIPVAIVEGRGVLAEVGIVEGRLELRNFAPGTEELP